MTTKVPSRQFTSGSATDGQVLTADGVGGAAFSAQFPKNIFSGYRTAGNVTSPSTFICNVADINQNSAYNTTTGDYTVPTTGIYELSGVFSGTSTTSASYMQIYKNGVATAVVYQGSTSGALVATLNLTAGDTLSFYAGPTSGRIIYGSGGYYNYFSIKQIG